MSVTTSAGNRYVLKRRNASAFMDREPGLTAFLRDSGLPVAVPMPTRTGAACLDSATGLYALYPRLDGEVIREHYGSGSSERAHRFGRAIARLHLALQQWPGESIAPGLDLVAQVRDWALPCIRRHSEQLDCARVATAAAICISELEPAAPGLPVQWIHRDIHPANMLFVQDELTGILDFEMAQRGPRVFDPCYCATSILIGGWKDPSNRSAWPGLLSAILAGYEEAILLSRVEKQALTAVLCAIELIFMAFSLEHGQFGPARCNQEVLLWLLANRPGRASPGAFRASLK